LLVVIGGADLQVCPRAGEAGLKGLRYQRRVLSTQVSEGLRHARAALPPAAALALTCAFLLVAPLRLDAEQGTAHYIHDQWGTDRGFPGGTVYALTQTPDGYLWIGTEKGLVRFDGLTFRLFEPRASTITAAPAVLGVAVAPTGDLWARLRGPALIRYHGGAFENILPTVGPPEAVVSAMVGGRDGSVLLATVGQGAMVFRDGRFHPILTSAAMPTSSFVVSIAESPAGEYWLGTRDAGLVRVQGSRVSRVAEGLPDLKINTLLAPAAGDLWIGTDKGIARWNGSEVTRAGIPATLRDLPALAMAVDSNSNIWIAAGPRGLIRVDPQGQTTAAGSAPASGRHVSAVFEDRERNLWVGTDAGVERWRDPVFTTYSTAHGVPREPIGSLYVDNGGRTWFAPIGGGLFWIENGVVTRVSEAGLDRDVVYSIDGAGGEVWVGRQRGGITRLRLSGGSIDAQRLTRSHGLTEDTVFVVTRARDGTVWAGTLGAGVSRIKDGAVTTFDATSGLASNSVASILEAADGTIWFATPNGLSALSRGAWRTYTVRDGLPSNDVSSLFEDRGRTLWVGTASGIAVVEAGSARTLSGVPPALTGSIRGFAEDAGGSLWVATADRIVRVTRDRLKRAALQQDDVREYGAADGLLGLESVRRHRTIVADARGRIWTALNRGISVTDPTRAEGRALPALTHVETMSADGVTIDLKSPIAIPSSRRRIAFGFVGLSLAVPERVRFRYRLDGFDGEWSEPVTERQAVYTNLAPGPYRFRVTASNSDGLWNGSESTLAFDIRPMIWQRRSFQVALVLLGALIGWIAYRLRLLQMARQLNVRFEERLTERTRIAQELHDTLLQGFLSASMQLHVAFDRLPEDSPARAPVRRVLDLMARVIDEGRNAVRGLRSSSTPHDLEQAFSGIHQELDTGQHATYRVIVQGTSRPLNPAIRDDVYRIGREALVNAFSHSGATDVELEIEYGPRELRLFVRDDGRGMDPEAVRSGREGHWGITGMRERAERLGASFKLRSRLAAGTEVELRVPAPVAFERAAPQRPRRWAGWLGRSGSRRELDVREKQL
jgi:signal transduction histidine kinase